MTRPGYKTLFMLSVLVYLIGLDFTHLMACLLALPSGLVRFIKSEDISKQYLLNLYGVYIVLPICNMFGTAGACLAAKQTGRDVLSLTPGGTTQSLINTAKTYFLTTRIHG